MRGTDGKGKRWIQILVLSCLFAAIGSAIFHSTRKVTAAAVGTMAPNFSLYTFDKQRVALEDLRGKPVVLNFWASWCEACKIETPDLIRAYETYRSTVQFVGVDLATGDQTTQAQTFMESYHIPYTMLADQAGDVSDSYHVTNLPTTYFIDSNGRIASVSLGAISPEKLDEELRALISHS